jgi:Zn-dependent protease with chaperone function
MQFKAKFFDGTQARPFQVDVTLYAGEMHIVAAGAPPIVWSLADIIVLDRYNTAHPAKLSCKAAPDARLVVNDADLWQALLPSLQTSSWQSSKLSASWLSLVGYAVLSVLVIVIAVHYVPRLAGHLAFMVPESMERKIGHTLLESEFSDDICIAPEGLAAFDKLWRRIDGAIADPHTYKPFVIKRAESNAFAVPGGYIVVFSDLLKDVKSIDELAGILAHERGHVEHRHGIRAIMRYLGIATVMQVMLGNTEVISSLGIVGALRFGRKDEEEADVFAIEILQKSAFDPTRFADFFERRMAEEGDMDGIWEYMSTHPSSKSRIEKIRAAKQPAEKRLPPALTDAEWQSLQKICDKTQSMQDFLRTESIGTNP